MDTYDIDKKHIKLMNGYNDQIIKFNENLEKYKNTKHHMIKVMEKYKDIKNKSTDFNKIMKITAKIISLKNKLKNIDEMFYKNSKNTSRERDNYIRLVHPYLSMYYINNDDNTKLKAIRKYILKIDSKLYTSVNQKRIMYCDTCESEDLKFIQTGQYFCEKCGNINNQFLDEISFDTSYDSRYKTTAPNYSRKSFFMLHLSRLLCITQKNKSHISDGLVERIKKEMYNDGISNLEIIISSDLVIKYLKKLELNDYTYDVAYIISKIKHERPPVITTADLSKLTKCFQEFELIWPYIKEPSQKSINYQYVLRKLLELLENYDIYLNRIKISQTLSNVQKLDKVWKKACIILRWQFIPTHSL